MILFLVARDFRVSINLMTCCGMEMIVDEICGYEAYEIVSRHGYEFIEIQH